MNYEDKLKQQTTFNTICEILYREFGSLPEDTEGGIVAGGAVASAVFEALNIDALNIKRYKDLDIFIKYFPKNDRQDWSLKIRLQGVKISYDSSFDSVSIEPVEKKRLAIHASHTRDNRLNYVFVEFSNMRDKVNQIMDSFDLNCCKVAIDLSTRQLHLSKQFIDFLYHHEVRVDSLHTANHTSVRYLEKAALFKQTPNPETLGRIADMCALVERLRNHKHATNRRRYQKIIPGYLFSFHYKKKWDQHKQTLRKVGLTVTPVVLTKRSYNYPFKCVQKSICLYEVKTTSTSERVELIWGMMENIRRFNLHTLNGLAELILNDKALKLCTEPMFNIHPLFYLDLSVSQARLNLNSLHLKTKLELQDLLIQHNTDLVTQLVSNCSDAQQLATVIKNIMWFNNHYPATFGRVEQLTSFNRAHYSIWLKAIVNNMHNREALRLLATKEEKLLRYSLASHVIQPVHGEILAELNKSPTCIRTVVREICSLFDLMDLGDRQKHCVGGYFDYIEAGHGSIFELKDKDGYCSTLQIACDTERTPVYRVVQHRTTRNTSPTKFHTQITHKQWQSLRIMTTRQ